MYLHKVSTVARKHAPGTTSGNDWTYFDIKCSRVSAAFSKKETFNTRPNAACNKSYCVTDDTVFDCKYLPTSLISLSGCPCQVLQVLLFDFSLTDYANDLVLLTASYFYLFIFKGETRWFIFT